MFYPYSYQYKIIKPENNGPVPDKLVSCLKQLAFELQQWHSKVYPIKINLFFKHEGKVDCSFINSEIESSELMKTVNVSPVIIAQAPTDGSAIQIALTGIDCSEGDGVLYKADKTKSYVSIRSKKGHWLFIGAKGCNSDGSSTRNSAGSSFSHLAEVLKEEGLSFNDILRQWNYIPDIFAIKNCEKGELQNYQEFNEVRGQWYRSGGLENNFPAATGIGTRGEVVRLEIIAGKTDREYQDYSLQNPDQRNAHQYSKGKLLGTIKNSTPLFERGKMVFGNKRGHIWVSGTAAIKGEESISGDVLEQSRITCENIDRLIDRQNLYNSGLPKGSYQISEKYIRAYVKYLSDGPLVREFLLSRYPDALIHVLEADVCREELLVEVEAEFAIS